MYGYKSLLPPSSATFASSRPFIMIISNNLKKDNYDFEDVVVENFVGVITLSI